MITPVKSQASISAAARIPLLREALLRRPEAPALLFQLADALIQAGEGKEAAALYRKAVLYSPGANFPGIEMAQVLLEHGVLLPQVLAGLAIGASKAGRVEEVRRLVDYDRFVRRIRLPIPRGFTCREFHAALAEDVRSSLTFYRGEGKEPSTNSWQNDSITRSDLPAWLAYRNVLRSELDQYAASLSGGASHPFIASRPKQFQLDGWAFVSRENGHITSHFHPRAWVTTIFYVMEPAASTVAGSTEGWLSIGPPEGHGPLPGWETRLFEPEEGTLLIMPGYYFHRTLPFTGDQERISLVVDAMIPGFVMNSGNGNRTYS